MKKLNLSILILSLFILGGCSYMVQTTEIDNSGDLIKELELLKPFVGKTYRGIMGDPNGEHSIDIQSWERILNGTSIRIMHSVDDGAYGGESILYWDKQKERIAYYYFTTAGFITHGYMLVEKVKYTAFETVEGSEQGITEVKSTTVLNEDGSLTASAEYFKNGKWIPGHKIEYTLDMNAKLKFK